jgi:putative FmdB family regulatory protein
VPLYEYVCEGCAHQFEALVFSGDRVECPQCKSEKLQRQVSVPGPPKVAASSLPTACRSSGPPCGPACQRWGQD